MSSAYDAHVRRIEHNACETCPVLRRGGMAQLLLRLKILANFFYAVLITSACCSIDVNAHPQCSSNDLQILQGFQKSVNSSMLLTWSDHLNCCLWVGVRCNSVGQVISIILPSSKLTGGVPPSLFNLSALQYLNLSNNGFSGEIPQTIATAQSLTVLDLSRNYLLTGHLPLSLPPRLWHLDVSHCAFHGSVPKNITNSSSLRELILRHNHLSSFAMVSDSILPNLQILDASDNLFTIDTLQLLMNCTRLRQLNLDRNQIKGRIPLQLGELTNLEVLRLDDNILQGTVPESIGNLLLLEVLSLSNNRLYGPFPKAIIGCASLRFLSLSENMLAGNIPADLGKLQNLSFLLLSGNQFSGHLPFERKFLMQLEVLDVSRNTLDRRTRDRELLQNLPYASHIPSLSNCWPWQMLRSLQFIFDIAVAIKAWLSQNSLYPISQHVPSINHKWQHTSLNCIMPKPVMPYRHLLQTDKNHDSKNPFVVGVVAGIIVFICILLITAAVIFCRKKMRDGFRYRSKGPVMKMSSLRRFQRESSRVFDPTLKSISMRYLFKATDGFDMRRVVGDGGFGLVYWATMEDGRMMAVKKLATDGIQGKREFEAEMETLGRIKHPNLIELLAYCKAGEDRVLVYEFVRNGSLDTWLHEREDGPKQLNWNIRLKIACGSAKGLCYLHHESNPHIIHRDIKSSNILLGDNFEPKIADFGLARALSPLVSHVSTDAAGTLGYMAPEYVSTMFATKQADVYSFGMVMLELVTGKRPNMFPQEKTFRKFHKWARHMLQIGHEMDMLDPALKGTPPPDHVRTYFGVACDCVSEIPNDRPTMREVNERLSLLAAMQCS